MQWCANHPEVIQNIQKCARCGKMYCPDCLVEIKGAPYCGICKTEQVKDVQSGTDESGELASPWIRLLAIIIDGFVVGIPLMILAVMLSIALAASGFTGFVMQLIVNFSIAVPMILYEGVMLQWRGQTVGKMLLNLKVVTPDGGTLPPSQAWLRAATRNVLGLIPLLGLVNVLTIFGQSRTCIHDMAAKTRVVRAR